jgi:hypothetical protein
MWEAVAANIMARVIYIMTITMVGKTTGDSADV